MIQLSLQKTLSAANGEMQLSVDLHINRGEFVTLYGNSGAGKTSILRIIAGLLKVDQGQITVNGIKWLDTKNNICLAPQKRKLGFVFQDYALFPNMNVYQNLEFALEKGQNNQIVNELIEVIELQELKHRKPEELSGGQKQRVALARALVRKPEILLLDEPLSALDEKMRAKLQNYILKVHRQYQLTTVLVSHDIGEVIKLSDKIILIENGKITKQGNPIDIFTSKKVSGKFQFTGKIIQIEKEDIVFVLTILIDSSVVKVIADESELANLAIGDNVLVASKAFNPLIQKI